MKITFSLLITALTMTSAGIISDSAGHTANNHCLSGGKVQDKKKSVVDQVKGDFYVAANGSDNKPGTFKEPFQTLERARDAIRQSKSKSGGKLPAPVMVFVRGGTYFLNETLVFGPEDSGTREYPITYAAYPGEMPVFSGGQVVTGWKVTPDGTWKASVNVSNMRQFFVNGRRAPRAGIPAPTGLEEWANIGYRTQNESVAGWSHPEDIEFVYSDQWIYTYCKVARLDRKGPSIEIRMQQPFFTIACIREGIPLIDRCYPRRVENSLSFLREPGQWYFDRHTKVLYYKPLPDEDLERTEGIVPMTERLLELRGTPDEPVHNLCFEDLTFADATWLKPSETGLIDLQANFTMGPETRMFARNMPGFERNHSCLNPYHMECTKSPASVVCHAARAIRFTRCAFTRLGGAGLDLECGAQDNLVSYCIFSDIAGSGVQVGDVQREDHHPDNPHLVVRNNIIRDCIFRRVAQDYKGGVGVFVGYTDGTTIEHCEFHDLPYSAISVGWGWGELDAGGGGYVHPDLFDTPTPCANNHIENNHIHDVMLELNDGGAIYTLGEMPGTVIRGNHIHDSRGGPGGIYLDEGSGHIEVSSNVVYRTARPLNFNNLAQNRRASCTVRDNHIDGPDAADFPRTLVENAGPRPAKKIQVGK